MSKIWFVDFPTYQYKEDVKVLAKSKGLKVINAKFKGGYPESQIEKNPPKLTKLKAEK